MTASGRVPPIVSRDIREFLSHYPSLPSTPDSSRPSANYDFYRNVGPARPSRSRIDELHSNLRGNYDELEYNHSFIQWLFPIREMGVNYASQPLELHEIPLITSDRTAFGRLSTSYSIMLDFYGMKLVDPSTGLVARNDTQAPSAASWLQRYNNLQRNSHNFLRITRILKCKSEFGLEHLNIGWILFFLVEQARGELNSPGLKGSMDGYWRWCIRNAEDRDWVVKKIESVRKGEPWTEEDYRGALERRKASGSFDAVTGPETASDGSPTRL